MSQDNRTIMVPFHGDTITAVETPEGEFVAIKPICERLGIAANKQIARLSAEPERWRGDLMVLPSAGGAQETYCIPLTNLAAWLFSINANRVKPEFREGLVRYQREAADVLDRHFRQRDEAHVEEIAQLRWTLARCHAQLLACIPKWAQLKVMLDEKMWIDTISRRLNWTQDRSEDERQLFEDCGLVAPASLADTTSDGFMRELRRLRAENERLHKEVSLAATVHDSRQLDMFGGH
jgi:hypothetical protein